MSKRLDQNIAIQRLTALWALTESGLGGLMHALNSSYTGLVVGGISIVLISLICFFSNRSWNTITKALLLVLIVKFIVSPHSQMTAYFAVSFQAISGYLFYRFLPNALASFIFPIMALLESAFQRILVLAILFGQNLSNAIDSLGQKVIGFFNIAFQGSSTHILIFIYGFIHIIAGFIIGYFCYNLMKSIKHDKNLEKYSIVAQKLEIKDKQKRVSRFKQVIWGILIMLSFIVAYGFHSGGVSKGLLILSRTILIITVWYFILSPLILKALRKYLSKKKNEYSENIESIFSLFPYLTWIVNKVIKNSAGQTHLKRLYYILYNILMYSLYFRTNSDDIST